MEREGVEGRKEWRGGRSGGEEGVEGRKGWRGTKDGREEGMEGGIRKKSKRNCHFD